MRERPISVLHFTNANARGGAEEHMLTLLRGLDRARFRPYLVCPPDLADKLRTDLPADVELLPLTLNKPGQLQAAFRFGKFLRHRRVDILHSHLFFSSLFASPIGWLCGVPVVLETPHLSERWRHGWFKSHFVVDRFVGRFVDRYIAVSEANARYLAEEKKLPKEKIEVIQNGCDLARFVPGRRPPAGLKESLGFHEADPVFLVMARLEPQKGHRILLQSMATIAREFPRARLVCLGDGCLRNELESQVRDLGLEASVRFLGHRKNVEDWLALADFTVLPSLWEGLPLAVIESLAAGCPVIATAVDGTPEAVVHEKTGLTVPPDDAESLARAICRLLQDSGLGKSMAEAGCQWVMERFSQQKQISQTQDLYSRAWERHKVPASRMIKAPETNRPQHIPDSIAENNR